MYSGAVWKVLSTISCTCLLEVTVLSQTHFKYVNRTVLDSCVNEIYF